MHRDFIYQNIRSLQKVIHISSSCWILYFLNAVILMPFFVKMVVHVTIFYLYTLIFLSTFLQFRV